MLKLILTYISTDRSPGQDNVVSSAVPDRSLQIDSSILPTENGLALIVTLLEIAHPENLKLPKAVAAGYHGEALRSI